MDVPSSIHFFIDENQPFRELTSILGARAHRVSAVQVGFKDPAILITAEEEGAVIVTADTWFLKEIYRFPSGHRRRFVRAGVVQVPGKWQLAQERIVVYLPVIEALFRVRQTQADRPIGIDLSQTEIRIIDR